MVFFIFLALHIASAEKNLLQKVDFASKEKGQAILTSEDEFIGQLSRFDRSSRLKTDKDVSQDEFLNHVSMCVMPWNDSELSYLKKAINGLPEKLLLYNKFLPERIVFIKTSGQEEGGAAYTRQNAIILPEKSLTAPFIQTQKKIVHELFHVISRQNPKLRDHLYQVIGFSNCSNLELPQSLKHLKITNPDAPLNNHFISLQYDGESMDFIPILISKSHHYDMDKGGEFFNYLKFQFIRVRIDEHSNPIPQLSENKLPQLVGLNQVENFFSQVGTNTRYILHPEEILADNFVHLIFETDKLPTPNIILSIQRTFSNYNSSQ